MSERIRYELQTYDTPDGRVGTKVRYPEKNMTVDLGVISDAALGDAIVAAYELPGPVQVREWDAEQERKRAADAGEPAVEDIVAGWAAQGLL